FTTRHGDDTFPFIFNWKTGNFVQLRYPVERRQIDPTPFSIEHCTAMAICGSFIIVVLRTEIHISAITTSSDRDMITSTALFTTISPHEPFSSAVYIQDSKTEEHAPLMHWYMQDAQSQIRSFLLIRDEGMGKDVTFSLIELSRHTGQPPLKYELGIARCCVGLTGKRQFWLSSHNKRDWVPPQLFTAPLRSVVRHLETGGLHYGGTHSTMGNPVRMSKEGLPLLHVINCLDFDDGHGVLLIGAATGEFCLVNFVEKRLLPADSMLCYLPLITRLPALAPRRIFKDPVELDLPVYYSLRMLIPTKDTDSPLLIKEALRLWKSPLDERPPISEWSSDWSKFTKIWDWIIPFSTCERLFHCKTTKGDDHGFGRHGFKKNENRHILGVLPMSYSQFLNTEAFMVSEMLSDFWTLRNLRKRSIDQHHQNQFSLMNLFRNAREQLGDTCGQSAGDILEGWSDVQWEESINMAHGLCQ
ncbi:hypothetical protein EW145_g6796, partial [Phellinidium pouzarii]